MFPLIDRQWASAGASECPDLSFLLGDGPMIALVLSLLKGISTVSASTTDLSMLGTTF
jgi:hypothetical protein